jgi:hypothetical protein
MTKQDPDERFQVEGDPEDALRDLMAVDPREINAEELAEKHGVQGLALRNMIRAFALVPGHGWHDPYRIDAAAEARIVSHPAFRALPRR